MGKTTIEPPPPPDPVEIAQTDALFNRIDTVTPQGSLTFSGPERNVATLEFAPELQALFDQQTQVSSNALAEALARQEEFGELPDVPLGLDFSGLPDLSAFEVPQAGDFAEQGAQIESATFDRLTNLLRPELDRRQESIDQQLANRGLDRTGQLAQSELGREADFRNSSFERAALDAVLAGRQEQSRLAGEARASLASALALRGQGINEQLQSAQTQLQGRNVLFNELRALLGQNQVGLPGTQSFFAPGQADVSGAFALNQNAQNNAFQAQLDQQSSIFGGLATLGGSLLGGPLGGALGGALFGAGG